ncbi:MAG: ribosomal RNA small subunit methyltransferase A [Saprospiraceae bacterium]|nr:MAG: ribosomal RNA small subunit methyltransferase A [Saprospiraceae bacterium]
MRAKKSYGQHFLTNEAIARRIARSLTDQFPGGNLLEIGPGKGMLTKYLLEHDYNLLLVEADADMVDYLLRLYPHLEDRILHADFLKLDLDTLFDGEPFRIIGNFPYNISSQIVFKMLDHRQRIPELVGMFQREMARRIAAEPGSKEYGVISVLTQAWYRCHYLFEVGPRNFSPPPKVHSAVIRLVRFRQQLPCDETLFRSLVKQVFNQRRKMLRNTMKSFLDDAEMLGETFFTRRPESLSVDEFIELTNRVASQRG